MSIKKFYKKEFVDFTKQRWNRLKDEEKALLIAVDNSPWPEPEEKKTKAEKTARMQEIAKKRSEQERVPVGTKFQYGNMQCKVLEKNRSSYLLEAFHVGSKDEAPTKWAIMLRQFESSSWGNQEVLTSQQPCQFFKSLPKAKEIFDQE